MGATVSAQTVGLGVGMDHSTLQKDKHGQMRQVEQLFLSKLCYVSELNQVMRCLVTWTYGPYDNIEC